MDTYSKLQKHYMLKQITEEEYKKRKAVYLETILEMYCLGYLSKEELYEEACRRCRTAHRYGKVL